MPINLRLYQKQVITDTYQHIKNGKKRILIFAPTGAGKTIISSQIVSDALSKKRKVLFIVHRDILVSQTYEKFKKFGLNCGFIKSGWLENRDELVQIASIQTLLSRTWWKKYQPTLIMLDECHITAFSSVVKKMIVEFFPNSIYLGLTATPFRLSSTEGLGDIFEVLVCAPKPGELIDQGFLIKPSYYGVEEADLRSVTINRGEYNQGELAIACNQPKLIEQVVSEWQRLAEGRRTIVFAVNVAHSISICAAFTSRGISSAHVDGTTPIKKRNRIYHQLATGEILVLCSCMALTEGFDVPSVNAVLLCRPTQSKALYFQMVGRGLRLSPETKKLDCIVLDQSGNVCRHGFIEDLKQIILSKGKEKSEDSSPPTKVCPTNEGGCGEIIYAFYKKCPQCQYNFEVKQLTVALGFKQLIREQDLERIKFYREKLRDAFFYHYSPGWAAKIFKEKFGHFPPLDWGKNAIFGESPHKNDRKKYQKHLKKIGDRLGKDKSWIERYLKQEFF